MKRTLLIVSLALVACTVIDATALTLPLEATMVPFAEYGVRALLRGLWLDDTLHAAIAPACAGLRTTVACALVGAFCAKRWWVGAPMGTLCGLALNLLRIAVCELVRRVDPTTADVLHATALYTILLPTVLLIRWVWLHLRTRPARVALATAFCSVMALLLLGASASTVPELPTRDVAEKVAKEAAKHPLHPYHDLQEANAFNRDYVDCEELLARLLEAK